MAKNWRFFMGKTDEKENSTKKERRPNVASLLGYVVDCLSFLWFRRASLASTAVEAMCTDTLSGNSDGFHQIVDLVETK